MRSTITILLLCLPYWAGAVGLSVGTLTLRGTLQYLDDRDDGQAGTGSLTNPYDASDATKLAALWSSLGTNIVILPGTYSITSSLECTGKTIRGSGTNETLIQWTAPANGIMFSSPTLVSDMELDAGSQIDSGGGVPTAVRLTGSSTARNLLITHLEGYGASEGFGVLCFGSGNRVDNVQVIGADGHYVTGIGIGSGTGCVITNCLVDFGVAKGNPTNSLFGFGVAGYNCRVVDSTFTNCAGAAHHDTSGVSPTEGVWSDNTYSNLTLSGTMRSVWFDTTTQRYSNYLFSACNIIAQGHDGFDHYAADQCDRWVFLQGTTPTNVVNFVFTNCTFSGNAATNFANNIVNEDTGVSGLDMRGNTFDPAAVFSDPENVTLE